MLFFKIMYYLTEINLWEQLSSFKGTSGRRVTWSISGLLKIMFPSPFCITNLSAWLVSPSHMHALAGILSPVNSFMDRSWSCARAYKAKINGIIRNNWCDLWLTYFCWEEIKSHDIAVFNHRFQNWYVIYERFAACSCSTHSNIISCSDGFNRNGLMQEKLNVWEYTNL